MITVGMNYQVLPGKEEVFENAFRGVLDVMKDMDGHSESHLYRDVDNGQSYVILSEWNDEEAFQSFIKSEQFAKVTNWGSEQILAGRPSHNVYR
ncbi:MAG: antibiotic biosynthesis monooxygenase [Planctomycetota bacterium]